VEVRIEASHLNGVFHVVARGTIAIVVRVA